MDCYHLSDGGDIYLNVHGNADWTVRCTGVI